VAAQRDRVAAAAHLLRYAADDRVGEAYRGAGEIRWLLFWPVGPVAANRHWTDATQAADLLMAACLSQLEQWRVTSQSAGGELPVPGVYGVPEQWPHVSALYERSGFVHQGDTEIVYLARIPDLLRPAEPPLAGLRVRRSVGLNGTRLSAVLAADCIGYIEVEIIEEGERLPRHGGWADIGNLRVLPQYRRRGVATWLLGQAADWLHLAGVSRLLDYGSAESADETGQGSNEDRAFLQTSPFTELTRTRRGWTRPVPA
jgi:GNAT superfamily N-acetyltransferase